MIRNEGVGSLKAIPGINMTRSLAHMFTHDEPVVIDDSLTGKKDDFVTPINGLNAGSSGIYMFQLPPVGETFLNLSKCYLYMRIKVTKVGDSPNCIETDNFSVVNNLGHSLFQRCDLTFNGLDLIPQASDYVNYKSYLESILSYESDSARETNLVNNLFHMDSPTQFLNFSDKYKNDKNEDIPYNKGYILRRQHCKNSRIFDLAPPVPHPFFRIDKAIAPNMRIGVKLTRATDSWVILSNEGNKYKVNIVDFRLYYERVQGTREAMEAPLEKYQFVCTELRLFPLPSNMKDYVVPISIGGVIPKQMIFFTTTTAAVNGEPGTNPFYFQHFDLEYFALKINNQTFPADGLRPDFTNEPALINRELRHLKENTGFIGTDRSNCVTFQQFSGGSTIFAFDTSYDGCNAAHLHPSEVGTIQAVFRWKNQLAQPITVFVFMVYDGILTHVPAEQALALHIV